MRIHRLVTYSAIALAIGGLLTAPAAIAAARHPAGRAHPAAGSPIVGHVAYLTKGETIKLAAVHANGATSSVHKIGPVSKLTGKQTAQVSDLMASGDGKWLAWDEIRLGPSRNEIGPPLLVLRRQSDGKVFHFATEQGPVGFAGDELITSDAVVTKKVVLSPSPHLVKVFSDVNSLAAYPDGVVEADNSLAPPGPDQTWKVELRSFAGVRTVLHGYVLSPTNYRIPEQAWVSGDGKHVVVERGDHTDFGGLGPSSLADEFRLAGGHARTQLGHYGTAGAKWRVASVAFAGSTDAVWAVWERLTMTGATTVVARHAHGKWELVTNHGIAVAANQAGWIVVQPGKYVPVGTDTPVFDGVPTSHALLHHNGTVRKLDAEGSRFVWVRG